MAVSAPKWRQPRVVDSEVGAASSVLVVVNKHLPAHPARLFGAADVGKPAFLFPRLTSCLLQDLHLAVQMRIEVPRELMPGNFLAQAAGISAESGMRIRPPDRNPQ